MKGYLSGVNRSSTKDQTERLKEEVSRRQEKISRIEKEIEQTYAECERQLKQKLRSKKPPTEPDQAAEKTPTDREQTFYATENKRRKGNQKNLKRFRCPGSR